ncbi:ferritin-like domain-containing protein [Sorangium sp. So ce1335]|uniref:ferritin-like domain-containing protein n=1 Tax=Sorangium sp. So ce1335 TaxID=3133335 RepID=UPI003F5FAF14
MTIAHHVSAHFRGALARHLTRAILATATLGLAVEGVACGGSVTEGGAPGAGDGAPSGGGGAAAEQSSGTRGGLGGQGGSGGANPGDAVSSSRAAGGPDPETGGTRMILCVDRAPQGDGGAGGEGGAVGVGGSGGAHAGPCPPLDPSDPNGPVKPDPCAPSDIVDGGFLRDGQCCYEYTANCGAGAGRPFLVGERARTAGAQRREASAWGSAAARPDVAPLGQEARAALAEAWLRDALLEHASVASFSRFALEMMAVGAPAEMLDAAHEAARDEVRHAKLCFGLASAYAGEALEPAPFAFGGAVEVTSDLPELAARAVREGCIGETLAAVQASAQLEHAADAAVRKVLATIADDEARHAELAWRFVAWALQTGGDAVRRAVSAAFEAGLAAPPPAAAAAGDAPAGALAAHGRPDGAVLADAWRRAIAEVVTPAMRALLPA